MRALVWLVEDSWEATVDAAARLLPGGAEVTLVYVVSGQAEELAHGAEAGLLGRHHPPPPHEPKLESISEEAARELLSDARLRLAAHAPIEVGGHAETETVVRHGRPEREVIAAAARADLLIMARSPGAEHPGPHSLGPPTRFVVDHAPCAVLLVWPA